MNLKRVIAFTLAMCISTTSVLSVGATADNSVSTSTYEVEQENAEEPLEGTTSIIDIDGDTALLEFTKSGTTYSLKEGETLVGEGTEYKKVNITYTLTDNTKATYTYFFKDGVMCSGIVEFEGATYYCSENETISPADAKGTSQSGGTFGMIVREQNVIVNNANGESFLYGFDADGKRFDDYNSLEGKVEDFVYGINEKVSLYLENNKSNKLVRNAWRSLEDGTKFYYYGDTCNRESNKIGLQEIDNNKYFLAQDGKIEKNTWKIVNGTWYYFDENGYAVKGLLTLGKDLYYMDEEGKMQTGWVEINHKMYYFDSRLKGKAAKGFVIVDKQWYYMNGEGIMQTGWIIHKNKSYYLNDKGVMLTGWVAYNKNFYYLNKDGDMAKSKWVKTRGIWYYVDNNGVMRKNWTKIDGKWFYFNKNGDMQIGWIKIDGKWFYLKENGAMKTGWLIYKNKWYFLKENGAMATDWVKTSGKWYYLNDAGIMLTDWVKLSGKWYFLDRSGAMYANRWCGNYYLLNNGVMATNQWIQGKYFVDANGKWVKSSSASSGIWNQKNGLWYYYPKGSNTYAKSKWIRDNGNRYYVGANGARYAGWHYIDGYKYYFDNKGVLSQNVHNLIGRQSSYYITVNRTTNVVNVYAKDSNGKFVVPVIAFTCSVGLPGTPTPTGTYSTLNKYRWHELMGPSYGQYCTRIVGGVLFHSVAGNRIAINNLNGAAYNMLGQAASHGCVRLSVRDAKWIYDNCSLGTTVKIFDSSNVGPFDKPTTYKLPNGDNLIDPTDPAK